MIRYEILTLLYSLEEILNIDTVNLANAKNFFS